MKALLLIGLALSGTATASDPVMEELGTMLTPAGYVATCEPLRDDADFEKRIAKDPAAQRELIALTAYCVNTLMAAMEAAETYGPAEMVGGGPKICLPPKPDFDAILTRVFGLEAERRQYFKSGNYSANDLALLTVADVYPCK